jgi:hypothetical protein
MTTAFVKSNQFCATIYKLNAEKDNSIDILKELKSLLDDWAIYPSSDATTKIKITTQSGVKIKFTIGYDEYPDNPFENRDMLGKIVTTKRCRYFYDCKEERLDTFQDIIDEYFHDEYYYYPLEIYDHSGVSVTLCKSEPKSDWDSGVQGYYIAKKDWVHNECGVDVDVDEVFRQMQNEIKELNDYWNESQYMVKYVVKNISNLSEDGYCCTGFDKTTAEYIIESLEYILKELGEVV